VGKQMVSVIIPCRNEAKYIDSCINSILNNDYGKENIEVIVVDGMSDDGTRDIIQKQIRQNSNIRLIDNLQKLTPFAFNLGIKNSSGQFIVIVGARHILSENYISACTEILINNKEIGCVGGKVENTYENETSELIALAMSSSFGVGGGNFRIKEEDCFVDTIGTPVYRKEIFNEVGFFDEELVRNQDDEFNYRVTKKGYKILYIARAQIKYYVRANYKNLFKQYFQYGYWKVFVNRKHKTFTTYRQLIPSIFILYVIVGAIGVILIPKLFILYIIGLILYFLLAFKSALEKSKNIPKVIKIVYVFSILHWAYGLGYLEGIIHFLILNRKPSETHTVLSR